MVLTLIKVADISQTDALMDTNSSPVLLQSICNGGLLVVGG